MKSVGELIYKKQEEFQTLTGIEGKHFTDVRLTMLTGNYCFDIFAFDDYCRSQGYSEEKHGSLHDYIKQTYGEETVKWIEEHL